MGPQYKKQLNELDARAKLAQMRLLWRMRGEEKRRESSKYGEKQTSGHLRQYYSESLCCNKANAAFPLEEMEREDGRTAEKGT